MCNSTEDGGRLSTDYDNDEFEGLPPDSGQSNLEEPFPALPASTSDEDKERSGDDITSAIHDDKLEIVKKLLQEDHDLIEKEFDYTFNEDGPEESWTSRGMTPLAFAARLDRFEISKLLLEEGADVFAKTKSNGTNTFWLAVLHEHLELADILLDRGTKSLLELRSDFGDTALIRFAFLGELKLVAYLLGKEADITAMEDESGDTALHVAAIEGHFEVVQMLWNARPAEIDILELRNKSGQTPLLAAAQCNQSEITKFLLDEGAKYDVQDNDGNTPLHYAAMTNDLELAQRLPKNEERSSESPDQLNADNKSKYSTILNRQNKNQDTPIVLAASSEQTSVFDFLLKSGANLNVRIKNGDTVLHRAAQTGNLDIVKKLLPAPAENPCPLKVQGNDPSTHQKGNGTTDFATSLGNFDLIKNHLGSTGNEQLQHVKNMLGQTPMMLAAQEEMFEVVEYLLGKNETFTSKGMNLEKAMLSSAENGYIRLIQGLWEVSDLREIQDSSGRTPLLIASDKGHAKIVEYLCQNGAKLGVKDDAGYTPILNAVWTDSVAMVKCLLNHGADQAATGTLGMNALHQACRTKGRSEILRILLADSPERLRKALSTKDMDGNTPLCDALGMAESAVEDSKIFQLLGSKVYFPLNPAQDRVHNLPEGERERVGTWLKNWIQKRRAERMQRKEREERERRPENEQSRGYPKPPRSQPDQQKQPDQNYNPNQKEENERIKSIIYWAILNNDEELMKLAMTEGGYPTLENDERRKSVTWLHVAALGNCPDIVSGIRDWETLIQAKTERDITPLHIAARMGHDSVLRKLLWNLSGLDQGKPLKDLAADNMVNVLHAIIHETKDDDNLISLIVAKQEEDNIASRDTKHRDKRHAFKNPESSEQSESYRKSSEEEKSAHEKGLVSELWETVIAIIQAKSQIFLGPPYSLDVEFIIKSMVSMHAIMEKRHFSIITSLMIAGHTDKKGDKLEASTSNILEWTTRYEFSLAFCWLLSSGDYFGEDHIKSCENAIKPSVSGNKKHNGRLIIEALLQNPPPIRTRKGDTKAPEFLYSIPYYETRMGTVIEISRTERQIYHNLNLKRSEIFEFVYDGPETPMKNDDTYTCKAIIEKLRSAQLEIETNQAQGDSEIKKDAKPKGRERAGIQSSQEKVRWLHIPVNDLRYVQELMVQVSRERGRDNNFYRSLIEFCQGSMLELAAGDGNHYMMPHFQSARNSTTEKNERSKGDLNVLGEKKNFDGVALYVGLHS